MHCAGECGSLALALIFVYGGLGTRLRVWDGLFVLNPTSLPLQAQLLHCSKTAANVTTRTAE